ncbi:fungal transcriptional regulatory protein [Penicillium riverlandense]|uniref:fungal transcriptional regulatory protein n=1 Tax=Penicillium riverlandense TaxID=1903569 RepID=UPI0025476E0C|nr:fungal transcriptional regulatory protein [Penicillium riverlandense]KAJ5825568.1 fungal transcriptional regulatory protein [Penicillium riverlandense]
MGASSLDASIAPENFNRRAGLIASARQRQGTDTIPMDTFAAYQALFPPSILHYPQSNTEDNFTPGPRTSSIDPAWDVVVWSQYMNRVPEWLSTKSSIWSCYHYLINLAQAIPNSPLFHGILSWTYAYLFRLGLYSESSRVTHYTTASQFVQILSDELSDRPSATSPASFPIHSSEKLSQYISTTFFLCHHDLIVGDFSSFITRINETKVTFRRHWKYNTMPGIIESRIVIWLAFMELRFLFLGGSVDSADHEQQDLMGLLVELNALSTLRGPRKQQSYLRECFGNGLPKEENDQELGKERCREKFDVIFSYFSKLRSFEVWESEKQPSSSNAEPLLKELREAKIDALRADLARIHAECELAFPSHMLGSNWTQNVDTSTFHIMTVRALCLCSTIMLNRVINPHVRTDPDAQAAARELVRLCRVFRKSKSLESPRSVIWPLPLFIAGIEIDDEVYQDWILDYMKDLNQWGLHVVKSRELLEQIIQWQDSNGSRASMKDLF